MEDLGNSSLTPETTETQTTQLETGQDISSEVSVSGQQPVKASTQEILDWTKDERHGRMWSNKGVGDPNKLYKSYKELEKVYTPLKSESETLKKQIATLSEFFKQYELEPDIGKLKPIFDEYKTLKDPENPEMKALEELKYWVQNEATSEQVLKFFNQLRQEEMSRKYPGWNAEQIQKQIEIERKIKNLEEKEQQDTVKADYEMSLKTINEQCDRAKKYAENKGFVFTDDIRNTLLDHCMKNNIDPKYVYSEFINLYDEQVSKSFEEKIKQDQLKGLNKNKGNVVMPAKTTAPAKGTGSLRDKFADIVDKMGIT
jgi:hypothetical protein